MHRLDHTGIGVADLVRSARFYDAVLGTLGLRGVARIDRERRGLPADAPIEDHGGIGYGTDYPVFWIDIFHPHGKRVLRSSVERRAPVPFSNVCVWRFLFHFAFRCRKEAKTFTSSSNEQLPLLGTNKQTKHCTSRQKKNHGPTQDATHLLERQ